MSTKSREQMTPAEIAGAQAASMERFYSDVRPELRCTANTHLIREWAKNNMPEPVLTNVPEIEWVVSQIGEKNLAVLHEREPEQKFVAPVPQPTYEEKVAEHQEKLRNADSATLKKLAFADRLRKSGYNQQQVSDALRDKGFAPLTESEAELLTPPTQTAEDVQSFQRNVDDEVAEASARIGQLLGRGPVSRTELIQMPNDVFRKLLWPHGQGTRKDLETERLIDVVLQGGSR